MGVANLAAIATLTSSGVILSPLLNQGCRTRSRNVILRDGFNRNVLLKRSIRFGVRISCNYKSINLLPTINFSHDRNAYKMCWQHANVCHLDLFPLVPELVIVESRSQDTASHIGCCELFTSPQVGVKLRAMMGKWKVDTEWSQVLTNELVECFCSLYHYLNCYLRGYELSK